MKISASVRSLFAELFPRYKSLMSSVDALIYSGKERRWHYESRIKTEQSFALKLETGREVNPAAPEDFFACTLVVENQTRIKDAEALANKLFRKIKRRPMDANTTSLPAHSFDFDDLRLYMSWRDDPAQKPSGLDGLMFELQIKTFLQHAWSIATHDLIYKTEEVNWATSRIAYQVKATLENAELSIAEARPLTEAAMLKRSDKASIELQSIIVDIRTHWPAEQLPYDLRRLAQNVGELARLLRIPLNEVWKCLDNATLTGAGAHTLNLSPHGAIVAALIQERGADALRELPRSKKGRVFIPREIEIPSLPPAVIERIVRPSITN